MKREIKQYRSFGLVVGGIFAVIGLWPLIRHGESIRLWALIPGSLLVVMGLLLPGSLDLFIRAGWRLVMFWGGLTPESFWVLSTSGSLTLLDLGCLCG